MTTNRNARNGARLRLAALALLFAAGSARAQLSNFVPSTAGSTCSGAGSADSDCRFSRSTTSNTGAVIGSRYAWNINADIGAGSTRDASGNAQHNLSFSATAPGGYRLDIATEFKGDMNRISDIINCDGAANVSGVTGSSSVALSSGTISVADPGSIGNGGGDSNLPFDVTTSATIFRVSNGVTQPHALTFTWNGAVRSNSCEAAVRLGESSGSTSGCDACGYPGSPSRTQSADGHFVTVTFTSLCGNGSIDAAAGEQCDLGAANGASTSCCTSTCQFRAAGQVCRPGPGAPCDVSETCSGSAAACPSDDAPTKGGTTCRVGSGDFCDPDEVCTGVPGQACPTNVIKPNGTLCRSGSGDVCDPSEFCTGVAGATCPANVVNGPSTICRVGSGDACDLNEVCTGTPGAACPPNDAPLKAGVVCRPGSGDVCDVNETCTGIPGQTCPSDDAPGKLGVVCRPSSADGSFCDLDETCPGVPGGTCPPNDVPSKVNVVCRPGSGDVCDPDERCTGIIGQGCPANVVAPPTTVCRTGSGDACDPTEFCTAVPGAACPADVVAPAGTVCRAAAGTCDVAEECSGTPGQPCPGDTFVSSGAPCDRDGSVCTVDVCSGSADCVFLENLDCEDGNLCTQDSCDPMAGCVSTGTPSNDCLAPTRASFTLKDSVVDNADTLKLKWQGGPVVLTDLGDPTQTARYELCIYDGSGVRMAMGVPPGAGWKALGTVASPRGYKYRDTLAASQGIRQISLKPSSLNKATLKVTGKGANLPDTALPFLLPVRAQLYSSTGACWDAGFTAAGTKRNDAAQFKARTP